MSQPPVRTRFAPSPTGYLHVGNVRTGLFAWLFAKHQGGTFFLRIEDTDRARFLEDGEIHIKESLSWLGLDWSPEVWHQSERQKVYLEQARRLLEAGHAYVADETPTELAVLREEQQKRGEQPHYDGRSRDKGLRWEPEASRVIRFKWPADQATMDVSYFETEKTTRTMQFSPQEAPSAFEDFVLIKADGFPTYNFAHVVDDHELGITHVIRGDEFVSSLNKYAKLYEVLDWPRPEYIHVPPILGPDGKKKLSKRGGSKTMIEYRDAGYLPEAVANFIALIGWSPGGDRELFFSLGELVEAFTLDGLQKSPGRFDEEKLRWLNKQHLNNLDRRELMARAEAGGFWASTDSPQEEKIFALAAERPHTLAEIQRDDYYDARPTLTVQQVAGQENPETVGVWLEGTQRELVQVTEWQAERIQGALKDVLDELKLVPKQLYPVLREALTGAPQTPALWDIAEALGQEETLARLEAVQTLVAPA